jgi:hypothetical protein
MLRESPKYVLLVHLGNTARNRTLYYQTPAWVSADFCLLQITYSLSGGGRGWGGVVVTKQADKAETTMHAPPTLFPVIIQGAAEIVKHFKISVTCFSASVSRSAGV